MLAVATGIPPRVWGEEGWQTISTAIEILDRATARQGGTRSADEGEQMSG